MTVLSFGRLLLNTKETYATFKVRKVESLVYKINVSLQKTTTCIGLRAEQTYKQDIYNKHII